MNTFRFENKPPTSQRSWKFKLACNIYSSISALSACSSAAPIPTGLLLSPSPPPTPPTLEPLAAVPGPYISTESNITAASCEFREVSIAVNAAVAGIAAGVNAQKTVIIPAGDCNWGTHQLDVPGGVYLQGAGRDRTTIRRIGTVTSENYLIAYNCSNGKRAEFSNISLIGNGNGAIPDKGLGLLHGCVDFTVSRSTFRNFIFSAVYVGESANQRGVIYSNNFIDNYSATLANLGYGVVVYGGGTWPPLDLGSPNAVFVEDNYFSGNRHNIASNNGSIYVFRHNIVIGRQPAKDFAMTDAHGLSSSPLGSRSYEIYGNTYSTNLTDGLQRTAIGVRGGDGVIFNNTVTPTIARIVELTTEGFSCGIYPGPYQIRSLYIWNNVVKPKSGVAPTAVDNDCPASIRLNRDYFPKKKPGYIPYDYPHPLRQAQ